MEEKARQIAIKYVYGNHDALTDEQEVNDMTKEIFDLVKEIQAKSNESLHDVIRSEEENLQYNIGYNDGARAAADDILSSI